MTLSAKLKKSGVKIQKRNTEPVWKGPEVDGVTQSLLSRFLVCRERFRLLVVEGLKPVDTFSHRLEYGQMWHVCEEEWAKQNGQWVTKLKEYCQALCRRYPLQQEQIIHWHEVCKIQFPLYVEYWSKHPDVKDLTPLLQEQVFNVPYRLPSGRVVRLRGKWDSVDLIGRGKNAAIYLQENKTKGDIDETQLKRQLQFDLQTMLYVVALDQYVDDVGPLRCGSTVADGSPIRGVRYNVVRRPLSGGAGSIRQHKPSKSNPRGESSEEFYERVAQTIKDAPETYFMRWNVVVTQADIRRFKRECLNQILEALCCWWSYIESTVELGKGDPWHGSGSIEGWRLHWRHPFGVYNVLDEGGSSELDEYLISGSELGLQRTTQLFGELQ